MLDCRGGFRGAGGFDDRLGVDGNRVIERRQRGLHHRRIRRLRRWLLDDVAGRLRIKRRVGGLDVADRAGERETASKGAAAIVAGRLQLPA